MNEAKAEWELAGEILSEARISLLHHSQIVNEATTLLETFVDSISSTTNFLPIY